MSLRARLKKYWRDFETLPADLRLVYRRGGWREVRAALADRSVHRLIRAGNMLVIAQDLDRLREVKPPEGVSIRKLADGDWPVLGRLAAARDLDRFRSLAARGHHCLIAWRGDQPVGYTWYTGDFRGVTMFTIPLPATASYHWDLYVPPAERSSGIGSALVAARLRAARDAGFREAWRIIATTNAPSLRTVGKTSVNGRVVGKILFVKLFAKVFARYRVVADERVPG